MNLCSVGIPPRLRLSVGTVRFEPGGDFDPYRFHEVRTTIQPRITRMTWIENCLSALSALSAVQSPNWRSRFMAGSRSEWIKVLSMNRGRAALRAAGRRTASPYQVQGLDA
jgi:hypothetical protein